MDGMYIVFVNEMENNHFSLNGKINTTNTLSIYGIYIFVNNT